MAEEPLHSIRFRRDGVEFEMTGTREDVAAAWDALQAPVVAAFTGTRQAAPKKELPGEENGEEDANKTPKRRRKPGTRKASGGGAAGSENLTKLLGSQVHDFPEIGDDPGALYAGYATLQWARDKLGIDGLTAADVRTFLADKLRIKYTSNAYRQAFGTTPKAIDRTGNRPQVFKLMAPGARALKAYIDKVSKGGTVAEAQAAGDEAEREAEN